MKRIILSLAVLVSPSQAFSEPEYSDPARDYGPIHQIPAGALSVPGYYGALESALIAPLRAGAVRDEYVRLSTRLMQTAPDGVTQDGEGMKHYGDYVVLWQPETGRIKFQRVRGGDQVVQFEVEYMFDGLEYPGASEFIRRRIGFFGGIERWDTADMDFGTPRQGEGPEAMELTQGEWDLLRQWGIAQR